MAAVTTYFVRNPTGDPVPSNALNHIFAPGEVLQVTQAQAALVPLSSPLVVLTSVQKFNPVITGITGSPVHGSTTPGIVITGSNFTGATGVEVGSNAATSVVVNSDTQITCTFPAQSAAGNYGVVVTTPVGSNYAALVDYAT